MPNSARVALLLLATVQATGSHAITRTWDPAVTAGDWFVGSNWLPAGVPGPGDDAELTDDGTYSVLLQPRPPFGNSEEVQSLAIGARIGQQQLTIAGGTPPFQFTASGGTSIGPLGILESSSATINSEIDNAGLFRLQQTTVEAIVANAGQVVVSDSNNHVESWSEIQPSGQLQLREDAALTIGKSFFTNVLTNDGLIQLDPQATAAGATLEVVGIAGINSFLPGDLINRGMLEFLANNQGGNVQHDLDADLFNSGDVHVYADASVAGDLQNQAGGLLVLLPGLTGPEGPVLSVSDQFLNQDQATIRVQTAAELAGDFVNQAGGILELSASPLSTGTIALTVPDNWVNHGVVDVGDPAGLAPAADLQLGPSTGALNNASSGELNLNPGSGGARNVAGDVSNSGLISGAGRIEGMLQNSGVVAPTGMLEIAGTLEQQGGQFVVEVAGPIAGVDFGQLAVEGDVVLNGTLQLTFVNGYRPPHGQPLELINWSGNVLFGMDQFDGQVIEVLPPSTITESTNAGDSYLIAVFYSADFDMDDDVDGDDYLSWQRNFGLKSGALPMQGDADGDGDVDEQDFAIWEDQYLMSLSQAANANVPEPSSVFLACTATLAAISCRGFRRAS